MRFLFLLVAALVAPVAAGFEMSGNVVDGAGQPVVGATVWISQDRHVRHTTTDDKGAFSFSEVIGKPAEIVARKDGCGVGGMVASVVGSGTASVTLGEPGTLALRIKNASYEPVAGASIRTMFVSDTFNVRVEDLVADGFPAYRSDEEGRLVIPDLPKGGHVRFVVSHPDYADTAVAYLPVRDKEQKILLYPGAKLRGRVTIEGGGGVARASVVVAKIGEGAQRTAAEVLTDPEGFYNATVAPGEYYVLVRHPDYAAPKSQHVDVVADPDKNVVDLVMQPPYVIEGSVVFTDGAPCPRAIVAYWIESDVYEDTLTQVDGKFRLNVPAVDGRIRITPPDGFMTQNLGDIAVSGEKQRRLDLAPIKLIALPAIEGTILGPDGAPQPNVLVSSVDLVPRFLAITDDQGQFRIQLNQAPPQAKAAFRAEHGLRFLRCDFEASLEKPKPIQATLVPFEPDLEARDPAIAVNDLSKMVGLPAPELICDAWLNTPSLTLSSLQGKVVVLTFWAGFDKRLEARDAIEELRALYDLFKGAEDVTFIAVHDNCNEVPDIQALVQKLRIAFPVGRDANPYKTFEEYNVRMIPQTVVIDKHGVLREYQTSGRLLELIKSLRREG